MVVEPLKPCTVSLLDTTGSQNMATGRRSRIAYFWAGAGAAGPSLFQVSRTVSHFPSDLRHVATNLPGAHRCHPQ
jgi:hypothetical protein